MLYTLIFLGWVGQPYNEFMVYYTTQSNILCTVVMIALAVLTFKDLKKGITIGRSTHFVKLEFVVSTYILLTCLIYNFLLGNPFTAAYRASLWSDLIYFRLPLI